MATPVSRSRNSYSPTAVQPSTTVRAGVGVSSQDTLTRANASSFETFSLCTLWDAIVDCFTSIFNYFFKSDHDLLKVRIAEIAARDHFVWFHSKLENPTTAFLGTFYPCQINILEWGLQFQCAEAAFQAAKFFPNEGAMKLFENLDGEQALRFGENLSRNWTPEEHAAWNARRLDTMHMIITEKFEQNEMLKELLFATGNAYLVKHTPGYARDDYWGDNSDGITGSNLLGHLTMEVRYFLGGGQIQLDAPEEYDRFITSRRQ